MSTINGFGTNSSHPSYVEETQAQRPHTPIVSNRMEPIRDDTYRTGSKSSSITDTDPKRCRTKPYDMEIIYTPCRIGTGERTGSFHGGGGEGPPFFAELLHISFTDGKEV